MNDANFYFETMREGMARKEIPKEPLAIKAWFGKDDLYGKACGIQLWQGRFTVITGVQIVGNDHENDYVQIAREVVEKVQAYLEERGYTYTIESSL